MEENYNNSTNTNAQQNTNNNNQTGNAKNSNYSSQQNSNDTQNSYDKEYYRQQGEQVRQMVFEIAQMAGTQVGEIVKTVTTNLGNAAKDVGRQWQQNEHTRRQQAHNGNNQQGDYNYNYNYNYNYQKRKVTNTAVSSTNVKGGLMLGFGWTFAVMFSIASLVMIILLMTIGLPEIFGTLAISFLLATGAFSIMINGGAAHIGRARRFKKYMNVIGQRKMCEISQIAQLTHHSEKFVRKDLEKMIDLGFFPVAFLNADRSCLFLDQSVFDAYMDALSGARAKTTPPEETIKKEEDCLKNTINEGHKFVKNMADIRKNIDNAEICEKIEKLENTASKIFDYVAEHPEKETDIHKFMHYYLPTTIKLLKTYEEMNAQHIQGETIENAMNDIKNALITIDTAFENLLDSLFQADALDIAAEISVMNTMLTQEGLANSTMDDIINNNK